ncbi:hypothetical protein ABHF33_07715 [Chitinibacter sp. FCG-7]|uniref:Lipoprotein n=1 Tax=Chitinibacter mangrovi TaxID=3153927 RepID=A0AAU7FES3_9NEIS
MNLKKSVVLAAAALALTACGKVSSDAKNNLAEITQGLNHDLAASRCVSAYADYPLTQLADSRSSCMHCDLHQEMGLIVKKPTISPSGEQAYEFVLTSKGQALYQENPEGSKGLSGQFCMAKELKLKEIMAAQSSMRLNEQTLIGVQYTVEQVEPYPEAADLVGKDQLFMATMDAAQKPKIITTTVKLISGKYLEQDPSFRYGDWINLP